MKSWKFKIFAPLIFILILGVAQYILWNYPVSTGKRVGNLTKISKKGKIIPTWEGTIDEGSGDKLTSYFSVRSDVVGNELFNYEGKQVIVYYEQYLMGWPWETNYNVVGWKPKDTSAPTQSSEVSPALKILSKTLFCSLLGSLILDEELYTKVKEHIKEKNFYLYKQFDQCNN
ncbi:MAG: hypothetical protein CME65_14885 [Halobacteriovoraceae bacterium]|nr:hypothetical protein [Halobacteriovoraceae bacterium]|tara:strand:+ start:2341 stop:2859 length:519 start_codon:yes stop_codon:yes gene_type:complete